MGAAVGERHKQGARRPSLDSLNNKTRSLQVSFLAMDDVWDDSVADDEYHLQTQAREWKALEREFKVVGSPFIFRLELERE